jgi:hypothetical protein
MAFATAEDLATYVGSDLAAWETATVSQALDVATSLIRAHLRQWISLVDNETITLYPRSRTSLLRLPERPVRGVDQVTDYGTVTATGTVLVATTDYVWTPTGALYRVNGTWGEKVQVVYDHGYVTIPDDIRGVCLSLAAQQFDATRGVEVAEQGVYGPSPGRVPISMDVLNAYRIPMVA